MTEDLFVEMTINAQLYLLLILCLQKSLRHNRGDSEVMLCGDICDDICDDIIILIITRSTMGISCKYVERLVYTGRLVHH